MTSIDNTDTSRKMATGKIFEAYDESTEEWASYIERLEQFFIVENVIVDNKKMAYLLSVMCAKTYALLRNLTLPEKPANKTYAVLVETSRKYLSPKPIIIAERFRFYKRTQREGESVKEYCADLKRLATHCEFGDALTEQLRDNLVCGLRNENMQRKLLSEVDLTFERCIELASAMEAATRDAAELHQGETIHKLYAKMTGKTKQRNVDSGSKQPGKKCYRCGSTVHLANQCRHKNTVRRACEKV